MERVEKSHLRLAFGGEGGDRGARCIENRKKTTSGSRFDAREVVVLAYALKIEKKKKATFDSRLDAREVMVASKGPPLGCIWTRGRWWQRQCMCKGH